jgi:hypothetical protein
MNIHTAATPMCHNISLKSGTHGSSGACAPSVQRVTLTLYQCGQNRETSKRIVSCDIGAHTASYQMGTRGSFPWGKAAGCDADHSPPSSAEVKNAWSYTSTPPIRLHGVVLS